MKHINIKTPIQSVFKIACTLLLVSTLNSCKVKEVLTDINGQKRSLVLFNPNFLLTNYQIRIFDTANKFLNKEMIVDVYSNKKIVNEEGYFKNSFKVTNGLLNFSVDPNEVISDASPIELTIAIQAAAFGTTQFKKIEYTGKSNFDRVFMVQIKEINTSDLKSASSLNSSNASKKTTLSDYQLTRELFTIGDLEFPIYLNRGDIIFNPKKPYGESRFWFVESDDYDYSENYSTADLIPLEETKLTSNMPIRLSYRNLVDINTMRYNLFIYFYDANKFINYYNINSDGSTRLSKKNPTTYKTENNYKTNPISNWNGIITIPANSTIKYISSTSSRFNTELKDCPAGFNFNFTNIAKGATPEIGFVAYRNDNKAGREFISNIGIAKVNQENPKFNTGEILYSNVKNKVVFQENSQYVVTPSTIELTGVNACGSTTNVKVIPKENLTIYKLAVKTQCEKDNFAIVANANVLFRKKGTTNWEGLTIDNGIATLYLENNAVYEVTGTYGKNKIDFNFTNDLSSFETQKNESLSKNKDLQNLTFAITADASGNKTLTMNLLFNQAACPFD